MTFFLYHPIRLGWGCGLMSEGGVTYVISGIEFVIYFYEDYSVVFEDVCVKLVLRC